MEDTEIISLGSVSVKGIEDDPLGSVSVKGIEDDPLDSVWRMIDISFRAV